MTGNLDMGGNSITNVNLVDGVDVTAHGSRHNPGGADAISTAAPGATSLGTSSAVGTSTSLARADHVHQSNTAPVNVTKAAAAVGISGEPARADHKHDVATAAPGTTSVATSPAEGSSTSLARADHVHQSNTPPVNITKSSAAIGTSGEPARADHKHDVSTATAIELTDSTNAEGTSTSLARADHAHAHGNRGGGSLHALAAVTGAGFMPQFNRSALTDPTTSDDNTAGYVVGSMWLNTSSGVTWIATGVATGAAVWKSTISGNLPTKAGSVLAASFAGTPRKATVTFTTPFVDASYAVTLAPRITASGNTYAPSVESQLAGSFVINMGTSTITSLVAVAWTATKDGESA